VVFVVGEEEEDALGARDVTAKGDGELVLVVDGFGENIAEGIVLAEGVGVERGVADKVLDRAVKLEAPAPAYSTGGVLVTI
jgi:hypothetical protein